MLPELLLCLGYGFGLVLVAFVVLWPRVARAEKQPRLRDKVIGTPVLTIGVAGEDLDPGDVVTVQFGGPVDQKLFKAATADEIIEAVNRQPKVEVGPAVNLDPVAIGLMSKEEFQQAGPGRTATVTRVGGKDERWELSMDEPKDEVVGDG